MRYTTQYRVVWRSGVFAVNVIQDLYQWGIHLPPTGLYTFLFIWLFVESVGFPISDEYVLLPAGLLATQGRVSLPLVIFFALAGKVLASCLAYWIGIHIPLERLARPDVAPTGGLGALMYRVRPTRAQILGIEARFRQRGAWGVFLGRLIPVVRSFISYPAGTARMPFGIFFVATTAGSFIWVATWTILGAVLGKSAEAAKGPLGIGLLVAAIIVLVGAYVWNHFRQEREMKRLEAVPTVKKEHSSPFSAAPIPPAKTTRTGNPVHPPATQSRPVR